MTTGRTASLSVQVTEQSREGWRRFSTVHGLTMTALAEAIGHELGRLAEVPRNRLGEVDHDHEAVLRAARAVDAASRARAS